MYDSLSSDYDRFVNWSARLRAEMPFLEQQLTTANVSRVLDAACGTGWHAIELAKRGFTASAADFSAGMIARAKANASAAKTDAHFEQAGFGELNRAFDLPAFDALLCLGNSLPHVQNPSGLTTALQDFAACLRPGGLLILQNRNFDRVLSTRERRIQPQSHFEGTREWLFIRFYDFEADGSITFHILTLRRENGGDWNQTASATRLWPLPAAEILPALAAAGFGKIKQYGSMQGEEFQKDRSPDLILVANNNS